MSEPVDWEKLNTAARAVVETWRRGLADDRRSRAHLRRAQSVDDIMDDNAFHRLRLTLAHAGAARWAGGDEMILGRVALAIAEIDTDTGDAADEEASPQLGGALTRISQDRLRLIVNTGEIDLFLRLLRGALAMVDRAAPVWDTAETVRCWHYPDGRRWARRKLLISYNNKLAE